MKKSDDWYRWRWEFMRHNGEYRESYDYALGLRKQCAEAYDPEESEIDYRPGKVLKIGKHKTYPYLDSAWCDKERILCRKVGHYASCMTDPKKSYDEIMEAEISMEAAAFFPSTRWGYFVKHALDGKNKRLDLSIDLSAVNSVDALCAEVSEYIRFILRDGLLSSKELRSRFGMHNARRSSKDFATLIEEGEPINSMKQDGFTYAEIAQKVWPGLWKKRSSAEDPNPETLEKRAQICLKDYLYFIEKGYREITFP